MTKLFLLFAGLLLSMQVIAQTGIGTTTPDPSAKLHIASTTMGFLPPRMTAEQRGNIQSPAEGLMVYQTDGTSGLYYRGSAGWIYIINSSNNVLPVLNGGTGLSALGTGVTTFLGTPTSSNLASAVTNETGSGALVFGTSPTISLPTITSGSDQFPQSIFISPSTHATSRRAAIWLDGWSILQDVLGNGTKNFSIGETISGPQYPSRLVIAQGNGNIGLGTNTPTARLNLEGGGIRIATGFNNSATRPVLNTATIGAYEIRGVGAGGSGTSQIDGADDGFLRLSAGGGSSSNAQSSIDLSGFSNQGDMNSNIVMRTSGTERLRINSFGNVVIGAPSPVSRLHIRSADATTLYIESTAADNYGILKINANNPSNWIDNWHELVVFEKEGSQIGKIFGSNNGTSVQYANTSDYRLKNDLKLFNGMELINKIKTYDFAWKSSGTRTYGVMAHELQEVIPYLVSGKKDEVDSSGKIIPQAVDYGQLTPILIKALQEQDIKIKDQQKQIDELIKRIEVIENKKS